MAWCPPGDKLLSEPMMVRLQTHICVTRPQRVNYQSRTHTRQEHGHDYWHADTLVPMGVHCSAIGRRSVDNRVLLDFCLIVSFGWADNVIQMTDENSRISQHFNFFNPSLTTVVSHLHYPRNQSRYASRPLETSLHCNDVSHWLGAHLDWSLLSSIGNVDLKSVLHYPPNPSKGWYRWVNARKT